MADDGRDIVDTMENKETLDRARLARERREVEQRRRLDELRAHAAAAQAQREKRDEERRKRQAEQRAKDDVRRQQVEDRKRAIWEASVSRYEAVLRRERERTERMERERATRSSARSAFAFGSSTPRLLEPVDSTGLFWASRRAASTTNVMSASASLTWRSSALHLDSETENNKDEPERSPQPVMWSSVARRRTDLIPTLPAPRAPGRAYSMTRLDKIPSQRPLHSTSPSMHHLNTTQSRSGYTTPGSRPGSAMSSESGIRRAAWTPRKPRPASITGTGVSTPRDSESYATPSGSGMLSESDMSRAMWSSRKSRPASIAGTTISPSPRGGAGGDTGVQSVATTPSVSRDGTVMACGDVPRRAQSAPRRARPASLYVPKQAIPTNPADGKPPLHRAPKPSKDQEKTPRGKSMSASPGRALSPSPYPSKEPSVDKEVSKPIVKTVSDKNKVSAIEVTQKLEALQIQNGEAQSDAHKQNVDNKINENQENVEETKTNLKLVAESKPAEVQKLAEEQETVEPPKQEVQKLAEEQKTVELPKQPEKKEEKKESSQERAEESEMTASMSAKRITTEEEAKAALAERRRKAREELERQAELERQRVQREAEEEAERQRQEEERQRREEEEAHELARLQRQMQEEKLQKAIEAQKQLEREEAERKAREEAERQARLKEDEEKRKAAEEAEKLRREEAERDEKERLARKQRVEAIMARTRLRKAEEDKKQQDNKAQADAAIASPAVAPSLASVAAPAPAPSDNGNGVATGDLLGLVTIQSEENSVQKNESTLKTNHSASGPAAAPEATTATPSNGNFTANLLDLSEQNSIEDKLTEQMTAPANKQPTVDYSSNANVSATETNIDNSHFLHNILEPTTNVGHISANFIQTERMSNEHSQQKLPENIPNLIEDDFSSHNGHGTAHNHPVTLQNAI